MNLIELHTSDGEMLTLEEDDGDLSIAYMSDPDGDDTPVWIPITVDILERLAAAARARTPIHGAGQGVIRFPVERARITENMRMFWQELGMSS